LSSAERPTPWLAGVLSAVAASGTSSPVVLVDGPSGAGKSDLADTLTAAMTGPVPPRLVRMDDLYPGWDGLELASRELVGELLEPLRATGRGRWRRFDWATGRRAEWHEVEAGVPLVVEGCGCLSRGSAPLADVRIWIDADADIRKHRALERDRGAFDAHWDRWDAQYVRYVSREHPERLADLMIDGTA
jgi:uridine kinase